VGSVEVIDLNADLGESFGQWRLGDDEAMLGVVTSANVACGFHAGDPLTLSRTCTAAAERGVVIGAQVGYRDLAGFGRRFVDVAADDLIADVQYQIGALDGLARVAGDRVRYVKPHGALYNTIVSHEEQAAAVVRAVAEYDDTLPVLGLPGSAFLAKAAESGLETVPEAFADRAYNPDGTLVSRRLDGSVLYDADEIAARVVALVTGGSVTAIDGSAVIVGARTVCVHGDTPGAVEIARAVRRALTTAGVTVEAFVGFPG
jgi:5-oxoprolinase (ATP-hydrolysing) subunit A